MWARLARSAIFLLALAAVSHGSNGDAQTVTGPMRGAFYYAGEPVNWIPGDRYTALMGEYDSGSPSVIAAHVEMLEYAGIGVGIYSWWGQGSPTDSRLKAHLDAGLKWAVYYELDHDGSRSWPALYLDLAYIVQRYAGHANYLHVNGKPAVFVYAPYGDCASVQKWAAVQSWVGGLYVNMTDVPNWWECNLLDSWHGYRPDQRVKAVYLGSTTYSMSVSAGFWSAWEPTPRLRRDFAAFSHGIATARRYNPVWELYYFNEFAEGTQIEPSDARCLEYFCMDYLKAIRDAR